MGDSCLDLIKLYLMTDSGALSRPAATYNNSQQCSQQNQAHGCDFEDDVFHAKVVQVLANQSQIFTPCPFFSKWRKIWI